MAKFEAWIKKNKWLAIGIGSVLIVGLYFLFFGRKSSSTAASSGIGTGYQITPGYSGGGGGQDGGGDNSGLIDTITDQYQSMLEMFQENASNQLNQAKEQYEKAQEQAKEQLEAARKLGAEQLESQREQSASLLEQLKKQYDEQVRGYNDRLAQLTQQLANATRPIVQTPSYGGPSYDYSSGSSSSGSSSSGSSSSGSSSLPLYQNQNNYDKREGSTLTPEQKQVVDSNRQKVEDFADKMAGWKPSKPFF